MKMNKFKVGDKVKVRNDLKAGNEYKYNDGRGNLFCSLEMVDKYAGKGLTITEVSNGTNYIVKENSWTWCDEMFNISHYKEKIPTHLVVWDEEDQDPCRFFTGEKEAKEFIEELSDKNDLVKDSIVLVEIKSAQKISISKNLKYNQLKI